MDGIGLLLSDTSLRGMLSRCGDVVEDSPIACSVVSPVEHVSGFFAATVAHPHASPTAVLAQVRQVVVRTGRPHFVWAAAGSPLALECWQQGLASAPSLAVMARAGGIDAGGASDPDVRYVDDHLTADLFRRVHLPSLGGAPDPVAAVGHFGRDDVLLADDVQAVVRLVDGEPVAAGLVHLGAEATGVYWVGTLAEHRGRGHGTEVLAALLTLAPTDRPVVLQATRLGRRVYLRAGFEDHGLVSRWILGPGDVA